MACMPGIFSYIHHKNQPNVGKYTSPMDGMGNRVPFIKSAFWIIYPTGEPGFCQPPNRTYSWWLFQSSKAVKVRSLSHDLQSDWMVLYWAHGESWYLNPFNKSEDAKLVQLQFFSGGFQKIHPLPRPFWKMLFLFPRWDNEIYVSCPGGYLNLFLGCKLSTSFKVRALWIPLGWNHWSNCWVVWRLNIILRKTYTVYGFGRSTPYCQYQQGIYWRISHDIRSGPSFPFQQGKYSLEMTHKNAGRSTSCWW